ncbi:MAG: M20/M25/M40 family metallo-hydrolase [Acidobacteria bacterium]|nr:M20/M25/M40 family metallo-hydrolase [Acidobacteriota bacterium]
MTASTGIVLALAMVAAAARSAAEETLDWDAINRIRDEGFQRSQVMETLRQLTDELGPRLTGSPQGQAASRWTRDRLAEWGLANAHLEAWGPFGRGWSFTRSAVHMKAPRETPLLALPKAWTPGPKKAIRGLAMKVKIESEDDFEQYRGKLKSKILFTAEARELEPDDEAAFQRKTQADLEQLGAFPIPGEPSDFLQRSRKRRELLRKLNEFLVEEKALATVDISSRDGGTLRLGGAGSRETDESVGVPAVVMALEHYNWILRLLDDEQEVELEIDVRARFHDDDLMSYNTIAEFPGSDLAHEVVMLGAHLDSWHAGTGANDNAAGCAVMMEAVRILKALDLTPRRTIRIALWTGEEQGLLGSRAFVAQHLASRPETEDEEELKLPPFLRERTWPISPKGEHETFSAYFNLDNGSGKIRGVYAQSNAAAVPIFKRWLEPFHDLGADTVVTRNTGGTDHLAFDAVGLPGFQFIQDQLDYSTRTHHTNLDVYDHAVEDDLKQASVIVASFVYHAAMRDEKFPRKAMPQRPVEKPKKKGDEDAAH